MAVNLQELLEQNAPIYVYNRAGRKIGKDASPYVLEVKDTNGRSFSVTIPAEASKYPFLVSNRIPHKILLESMEFRSATRRGGPLELVAPEKAKKAMQDPMAQKVIDAALKRQEGRFSVQAPNIGVREGQRSQVSGPTPPPQMHSAEAQMQAAKAEMQVAKQDVSNKVKQLVMDLNRSPDLKDDILMQLAGMDEDAITEYDIGYILNQCNSAKYPRIASWAKNELAKRVGQDAGYIEESDDPDDTEVVETADEEEPAVTVRHRRKRR
jgi:hypothetical protein